MTCCDLPTANAGIRTIPAALQDDLEWRPNLLFHRFVPVQAIPVGGLHHQDVAGRQRFRIVMQGHVVPADVAAEQEAYGRGTAADFHLHHCRSENMAGLQETGADSRRQLLPFFVANRPQEADRPFGVGGAVKGQGRPVLGEPLAIGVICFLFLDLRRIHQQDFGEIPGGPGAMDRTAETFPNQFREITGMIDMGVGEQEMVDPLGLEIRALPVEKTEFLEALEQAGINQDPGIFRLDQDGGSR